MKPVLLLIPLCMLFLLAACETDGKYPITGEDCGPNDPVQTLDAADCASAVPPSAGF